MSNKIGIKNKYFVNFTIFCFLSFLFICLKDLIYWHKYEDKTKYLWSYISTIDGDVTSILGGTVPGWAALGSDLDLGCGVPCDLGTAWLKGSLDLGVAWAAEAWNLSRVAQSYHYLPNT